MKNVERISSMTNSGKHLTEKLLFMILFLPMVNCYFGEILLSFDISTISTYIYAVVYILSLYSYAHVLIVDVNKRAIGAFILMFTVYVLSIVVNPGMYTYVFNKSIENSNFAFFWGLYFPVFMLCLLRLDINYLLTLFFKGSVVVLSLCVTSFILRVFVLGIGLTEYMTFAYTCLISIMICFHYSVQHKKSASLLLSLVSSIVIVTGGCRGALLTLMFFYVIYAIYLVFIRQNQKSTRSAIISILISVCIVIVTVYAGHVLAAFDSIINLSGYTSRNVELWNNQLFFESSSRNDIFNRILASTQWYGQGIYRDRMIIGVYAHNWILELLVDFGYILGGFVVIYLLLLITTTAIRTIKSKNDNMYFVMIFGMSFLFVKYSVSSSIFESSELLLFVGLLGNILIYGIVEKE